MIHFFGVYQVFQESLVKQNAPNWSFDLVADINYTIKFYILSRYTSVATTLSKVVRCEGGLPGVL